MPQVDLDNWEAFESELKKITQLYQDAKTEKRPLSLGPLLFRGQPDSKDNLTTTLERTTGKAEHSFYEYYRFISRAQPAIEAFTEKPWKIPKHDTFYRMVRNYSNLDQPDQIRDGTNIWGNAYGYMFHLRHHGFPSPLLDWTRSPYVAAYFAFRNPVESPDKRVSIFVYCENLENFKVYSSSEARIDTIGSYVRTHKRHFIQQSEYTICIQFKKVGALEEWYFVSHDEVLSKNSSKQDICWKFTLPSTERKKVLRLLDTYNITAHSLFGSEETLMETMALRELYFRG